MTRTITWLAMGTLLLGTAAGCGDDDNGGTDSGPTGDTGMTMAPCPDSAPDPDGQMGTCCWRKNNAMSLASPEMRIAGVRIEQPTSLASILVRGLLAGALDEERFNWLIRVTGADADGDVMIQTGYGDRMAGPIYAFTMGTAPAPGDPNRWDPVTIMGTLTGETLTAPQLDTAFTLPIFDELGGPVLLELPLNNMTLVGATMSEERSCIGTRRPGSWDFADGQLTAFITIADADAGRITTSSFTTTLCMLTAGLGTDDAMCVDTPQAMWPVQPDSLCEASGCTQDPGDGSVCDGATTCNSWFIDARFAAQGVEIAD